ncbi:hypothetical protein ZIOFF_066835 [Zingiber officinale]|uniref:Uncharacterized protein n=1 Tax=Zingiber officinale TaxID=94328 RepID=A0A8J5F3K1_ZINOF|nr:hypothetical protein ZIOFF_066835 [Zingiber officinale]
MGSSPASGHGCDYSFKVLLIGDSGVGKSSLLVSFISNHLGEDLSPTVDNGLIPTSSLSSSPQHQPATAATLSLAFLTAVEGVDFKIKHLNVSGKKLKLTIWDTVYDVTKRETFNNLADVWVKEVETYSTNHNCVKILVGNKVDKVSLSHNTSASALYVCLMPLVLYFHLKEGFGATSLLGFYLAIGIHGQKPRGMSYLWTGVEECMVRCTTETQCWLGLSTDACVDKGTEDSTTESLREKDADRSVTTEEGIAFADEYGCLFFECSAKTRNNVERCFKELALKILGVPELLEEGSAPVKRNILKQKQGQQGQSGGCCS